jgi:mono/diheme cytochrome c family protein
MASQSFRGSGETAAKALNKAFRLKKGANKLVAEFSSDGKSDATVRLLWWSREFPAEPVPPTIFSHAPGADERSASRIREGRMLFAQFRCAACHADPALPAKGEGLPELAQDAPLFEDLGSRYHETWLAHWINNPHEFRHHSLMRASSMRPKGRSTSAQLISRPTSSRKGNATTRSRRGECRTRRSALFKPRLHRLPHDSGREREGRGRSRPAFPSAC